jgi:phosphinothricin acetyltransferase
MDYVLRPVEEKDIQGILAILIPEVLHHTNNFDWDAPTYEKVLTRWQTGSATYPWFACIATNPNGEEIVAGYAMAGPFRDKQSYAWTAETTVYVHPDHHRKGIASTLYQHLLEALRKRQIFTAIACITMGNEGSIVLHENLGFRKTGEISKAGYKFNRWLDIGFWTLDLQEDGVVPGMV